MAKYTEADLDYMRSFYNEVMKGEIDNINTLLEEYPRLLELTFYGSGILAAEGKLEMLKFLKEKSIPLVTEDIMYEAAKSGNLDILKWIIENDPNISEDFLAYIFAIAVYQGRKNIVVWMDDNFSFTKDRFNKGFGFLVLKDTKIYLTLFNTSMKFSNLDEQQVDMLNWLTNRYQFSDKDVSHLTTLLSTRDLSNDEFGKIFESAKSKILQQWI